MELDKTAYLGKFFPKPWGSSFLFEFPILKPTMTQREGDKRRRRKKEDLVRTVLFDKAPSKKGKVKRL